jgi:CubicO group peptidase (beta-lactamase class C family)
MAQPLLTRPGRQRVASLCDGLVAGLIVEKVAGRAWATYLQAHIFGPLGMASSGGLTREHQPPHLARGYHGRSPAPAVDWDSYPFAYATAADIYRYDQALGTTALLPQRARDALFTPWIAYKDGNFPTMQLHEGYFWSLGTRADGRRAMFTTSGNGGFVVFNMLLPRDGVTVIVLSNDDADVARIAADIATIVVGGTLAA